MIPPIPSPADHGVPDIEEPMGSAARDGLRALGLICWLVLEASLFPWFWPDGHNATGWPTVGLWLLTGASFVAPLGLWFRWHSRLLVWLVGLANLAGFLLALPLRPNFEPINYWAPGYWTVGWFVWAMIVLPRRVYVVLLWVVYPLAVVVDLAFCLLSGHPVTRFNLEPSIWIWAPIGLVGVFGDGLVILARDVGRQLTRRRQADERARRERAQAAARSEAARRLHDHVLHALQAVSRSHVLPVEQVREQCRTAVAGMEQSHREQDGADLTALLADDETAQRLGVEVLGQANKLPRSVAEAMYAAAHEALVNVERHARASRTIVEVTQDDEHWRVDITDDGVGFDPSRPSNRLGLSHSVVERMADIGGDAQVQSAPGQGTSIVLEWPRSRRGETVAQLSARTSVRVRRLLLRTIWPGTFATFVMSVLLTPVIENQWAMALDCGVLLGTTLAYQWILRRRSLRWPDAVFLLGVSWLTWYVNLALAPDNANHVSYLWVAWGSALMAHLVCLQLRPRHGVVVLVVWAAMMTLGLVVRFDHVDFARLHPLVSTGVGEVTVVLVALTIAAELIDRHAVHANVVHETQLATARVQLSSQLEQFWSQRVTGEALPLLRRVADGELDPRDPSVVTQATQLEATLRDELMLGPGQSALLAQLTRVRRAGWHVPPPSVHPAGSDRLASLPALLALLDEPARPHQQATPSTTATEAVLVVLSPSLEQQDRIGQRAAEVGVKLDVDEGFLRLRRP